MHRNCNKIALSLCKSEQDSYTLIHFTLPNLPCISSNNRLEASLKHWKMRKTDSLSQNLSQPFHQKRFLESKLRFWEPLPKIFIKIQFQATIWTSQITIIWKRRLFMHFWLKNVLMFIRHLYFAKTFFLKLIIEQLVIASILQFSKNILKLSIKKLKSGFSLRMNTLSDLLFEPLFPFFSKKNFSLRCLNLLLRWKMKNIMWKWCKLDILQLLLPSNLMLHSHS